MEISKEQLPCYALSFNLDNVITYINQRLLSKLEYNSLEVIGKLRFEDLLTSGSRIFYKTHFLPMLLMQKHVDEMFLSFSSKSGKDYPVLLNMAIEGDDTQTQAHVVGLHMAKRNKYEKGILEAKQTAEKALLKNELLQKMKTKLQENQQKLERQLRDSTRLNQEHIEFSKILSHDLQEPLRKIQLFSGILEENTNKTDFDPELQSYFNKLQNLTHYSHQLLMRLQNYHGLEVIERTMTVAKLKSLIDNAISDIIKPDLKLNFDELYVDEIFGDIPKLTQVFKEILTNSYQFQQPEKPLSIEISSRLIKANYYKSVEEAYRYTDFLEIQIKDNAKGIPEFARDRVFGALQKFYPESGMGLGLAYCKKIINLHQGQISVKPNLGGGTILTIVLPLCQSNPN